MIKICRRMVAIVEMLEMFALMSHRMKSTMSQRFKCEF